jgi:hypothetical protein
VEKQTEKQTETQTAAAPRNSSGVAFVLREKASAAGHAQNGTGVAAWRRLPVMIRRPADMLPS